MKFGGKSSDQVQLSVADIGAFPMATLDLEGTALMHPTTTILVVLFHKILENKLTLGWMEVVQ